jgi:antitoxin MazE
MRVSKWGNSLAVRLPKVLVEKLGLKAGDDIAVVDARDRQIAIEKRDRRKAAIEQLKAMNWKLPAGYKFDREEANER